MSKGYQAYADALANSEPSGGNAAVLKHIGLVHKTALHIKARLPDHVELEELIQIGMVGLLEAAKSYDSSQGADLGTFASKRIRGAILDEVRKRSPLSRTDSSHIKAETMVVEQFSAKYGRPPTASEIAHELDTTLDDYQRQRGRSQNFAPPLWTSWMKRGKPLFLTSRARRRSRSIRDKRMARRGNRRLLRESKSYSPCTITMR